MKLKRKSRLVFAILVVILGLILLFYPFISNYLFEHRSDSLISSYEEETEQLDTSETDAMWAAAVDYNRALLTNHVQLTDPFEAVEQEMDAGEYSSLLSVNETGIMSYIDIPKIGVFIPVYHGTAVETLEKGVGHLEGSSLPVGGEGTHCILSGHTGLNRAKIFTDLSELEDGDLFLLHTLGETLAYEVDQKLVVEPYDVSALQIESAHDFVTLVTCTPYGVNTHRLLVRGKRIEYTPEVKEKKEAAAQESSGTSSQWMREYEKALLVGVLIVLILTLVGVIIGRWRKQHEKG